MHPFLAMIIPMWPGGQPPGIWGPTDPRPGWGLPPAGPGAPPGFWGGAGEPFPGYGLPGRPPGTWGGAGEPFPGYGLPGGGGGGGRPPGTWGGAGEPFPGYGLPGHPPGPWGGSGAPFPTPPIVIPPQQPGQPPLVIWGPGDPRPMPPIELPGGGNPPPGGDRVPIVEWHTVWSEQTGWAVIGIAQGKQVTPSGSAPAAAPKK